MLKSEKTDLNRDLKNKINALEHHTKDREKNDPSSWKIHQAFVVKPLLKMGFDETDIQEALGKLLVNTLTIGEMRKICLNKIGPVHAKYWLFLGYLLRLLRLILV